MQSTHSLRQHTAAVVFCIAINLVAPKTIPVPVTLFLFGTLISVRVAITVLDPKHSLVRLSPAEESKLRRRQLFAGFIISAILLLTMAVREVRESQVVWLLVPIIVLPFILLFRMRVK